MPEIVWEFSIIFIQVGEKSGKIIFSPCVIFSYSFMVVWKVVVPFLGSKCKSYHFAYDCSKYICITYLLDSVLITYFCTYVKWESGKKWVILTISQGIVRKFSFE